MADRNINVELTGDASDLQRALKDATDALEEFGVQAIRRVFANMLTFERATEALANALPRLGAAAIRAGQSVVRGFRAMHDAMGGVLAVMDRLHNAIGLLRDAFQLLTHNPFVELLKVGLEANAKFLPQIFEAFAAVWRSMGAIVTQEVAPKIEAALYKILQAFYQLTQNEKFIEQLKVGFTALGNVLEWVGNHAKVFVEWLSSNANAQATKEFLSSMLALLKTIGETLLGSIFPAFQKAFDPKNIQKIFPAILLGIKAVIDGVFGLGRVWNELIVILKGMFNDLGDYIRDTMQDATLAFKLFFANALLGFNQLALSVQTTMLSVANAINTAFPWLGIDTSGIQAGISQTLSNIVGAASGVSSVASEASAVAAARREREARKDAADPYRNDPIGKRIADAFFGRSDKDLGPQQKFWEAFNRNNKAIQDFLFGPGAPQGPAMPPRSGAPVGSLGTRVNPAPPMLPWWNRPGPPAIPAPPMYYPPQFNYQQPMGPATGTFGPEFGRPADRPWWWGGAAAPPPKDTGDRSVTLNFNLAMSRQEILAAIRRALDRELFDEFPGAPER